MKKENSIQPTRTPQMITVNGDKVSHGHIFQSTTNPENWYFSVKVNDTMLKPRKITPEEVTAFQNKEIGVPEMMRKYHPTKLEPRLPIEAIKAGSILEDGREVEKFNIYKERNPASPNNGKYMLYTQVGDQKLSVLAPRQALDAYFDRTETYAQQVTRNFGEQLHLASAYNRYELPKEANVSGIRVQKDFNGSWSVHAEMDGQALPGKPLSFHDGQSYFKFKTATLDQLAGKYFHQEISGKLAAGKSLTNGQEKTASLKI